MGPLLLLWILPFLGVQATLATGSFPEQEEEDYDFDNVVDMMQNNTVVINEDGVNVEMTWTEAIEAIKMSEIEKLKVTIKDQSNEIHNLKKDNETQQKAWNTEKASLESQFEVKLKGNILKHQAEKTNLNSKLRNQIVLVNFLTTLIKNNEKKSRVSRDLIEAQNEKLKILGEERKTYQEKNKVNLRQAYLQAEIIMKQETQKTELKEALKVERALRETYVNLTELGSKGDVNQYPQYVQMMTTALVDQSEDIKILRSFLDKEKSLEAHMTEVLEEMNKLNVTFTSDTTEWDLLTKLMGMADIQSASLASLKPAISYIVNNGFEFKEDEDGNLLAVTPCQCLPRSENTNVTLSGIQFTCPSGKANIITKEEVGVLPCQNGVCPTSLEESACVETWSVWSDWVPCTGTYCMAEATRTRGLAPNIERDFKGQMDHLIIRDSTSLALTLPVNKTLAVFAVGGGGGANSQTAGSSGFFKYAILDVSSGTKLLNITIGDGGLDSQDGRPTSLTVDDGLVFTAAGGGGAGRPGWTGVSGDQGGTNGRYGTGEALPEICGGIGLQPGAAGHNSNDGSGAGGVLVGQGNYPFWKPVKRRDRDGEGYGAGGGEDNLPGYPGVLVLMLCEK